MLDNLHTKNAPQNCHENKGVLRSSIFQVDETEACPDSNVDSSTVPGDQTNHVKLDDIVTAAADITPVNVTANSIDQNVPSALNDNHLNSSSLTNQQ